MTDAARPQREAPQLRTETKDTARWGAVVVRQLLTSDRLTLSASDAPPPPEGETEEERFERVSRNNGRFIARLLARTVTDAGGAPLFAAEEWDAWLSIEPNDCWPLANRALALNGYRTLDGEDVAKNA